MLHLKLIYNTDAKQMQKIQKSYFFQENFEVRAKASPRLPRKEIEVIYLLQNF